MTNETGNHTRRRMIVALAVFSAAASSWQATAVAVPLISLSADSALIGGDESVTIEIFVEDAVGLRLYEVVLEVTGGATGSLDLTDVLIDEARGDFVFTGLPSPVCIADPENARITCTPLSDDCVTVSGTPAYLGTYTFTASVDVSGMFTVGVIQDPTSFLLDCNWDSITPFTTADVVVETECNGNGVPDACDVDCGDTGGVCDLLGCGLSFNCDADSVPDECELDTDSDTVIDDCDSDDDNDGVDDDVDPAPLNPNMCGDADGDMCDDCVVGTDDFGPLPDNNPADDGPDSDADGICNAGDNCSLYNPNQIDCQPNDIGDVCDIANGTSLDNNADGIPDECSVAVPAVSTWGMILMAILVLIAGTIIYMRRAPTMT